MAMLTITGPRDYLTTVPPLSHSHKNKNKTRFRTFCCPQYILAHHTHLKLSSKLTLSHYVNRFGPPHPDLPITTIHELVSKLGLRV